MNEDITTTNLAQENTSGGMVKEVRVVERETPSTPEHETQHKMLHICCTTTIESGGQAQHDSIDQPDMQCIQCPKLLTERGDWVQPKKMAHSTHKRVIRGRRIRKTGCRIKRRRE